jgi:hypothetical protein
VKRLVRPAECNRRDDLIVLQALQRTILCVQPFRRSRDRRRGDDAK